MAEMTPSTRFQHKTEESPFNEDIDYLPSVDWSTWTADSCSVVKAFIGANYLGVSYAFRLTGLLIAVPLFWVIAFASRQGCRLLIECKIELDRRDASSASVILKSPFTINSNETDTPESDSTPAVVSHSSATAPSTSFSSAPSNSSSSYLSTSDLSSSSSSSSSANIHDDGSGFAMVGHRLFGPRMADLVKAMLVLTQFGYCVAYLIFLSQTMQDLGWIASSMWSAKEVLVPVFAAPLALLALPSDISRLV